MGDGEREGRKKGVIRENRRWRRMGRRKDGIGRLEGGEGREMGKNKEKQRRERWGRMRRDKEG